MVYTIYFQPRLLSKTVVIPGSTPRRTKKVETGIDSINNLTGPRGTAEQVADRIRQAIVSGNIPPGTRLLEAQLAARIGVSRIPVREALTRLEAEGLVERTPYQGARVMSLTLD